MQGVGHLVDREGIYEQRLLELVGRPGHFGQNEHPVVVELRRDVLLRHEVHPIAQRRHERHVRLAVQRHQLRGGERAHEIADRAPATLGEAPVDAAHGFVDLALQLAVLGDAFPARHHHLGERDTASQSGMPFEQALDREHPLVDAFRVIESVHAEDLGDRRAGRRPVRPDGDSPLGEPFDLAHVNADGMGLHRYLAPFEPDQPRAAVDFAAEQTLGAGEKVVGVRGDVDSDEVGREHALHEVP